MDYSFFALGVLGAFVGYVVGDFQRQSRYRRDARANLALANQRAADRANQRANVNRSRYLGTFTDSGPNGHGDDDGAAFALGSVRAGQARRRAVSRDHNGPRPGAHAAGGDTRGSDATPVMAGAWDFDGE